MQKVHDGTMSEVSLLCASLSKKLNEKNVIQCNCVTEGFRSTYVSVTPAVWVAGSHSMQQFELGATSH